MSPSPNKASYFSRGLNPNPGTAHAAYSASGALLVLFTLLLIHGASAAINCASASVPALGYPEGSLASYTLMRHDTCITVAKKLGSSPLTLKKINRAISGYKCQRAKKGDTICYPKAEINCSSASIPSLGYPEGSFSAYVPVEGDRCGAVAKKLRFGYRFLDRLNRAIWGRECQMVKKGHTICYPIGSPSLPLSSALLRSPPFSPSKSPPPHHPKPHPSPPGPPLLSKYQAAILLQKMASAWKIGKIRAATVLKWTSADACDGSYTGVQCHSGIVTSLNLSNTQLLGSIPESLGNLRSLKKVLLDNNQLSGSIPETLSNLIDLQYLSLNSNQLSGSIPETLGNLIHLHYLELGDNELSGSIPDSLGNLTSLQYLFLYINQLSGSIPKSLGNLTILLYLDLSSNPLSGSIPESLGSLINLDTLSLQNNQLSGSIQETLSNLRNLSTLDLSYNQLSGGIPGTLAKLTNLYNLNLRFDQLSGSIPETLGKLTNLYDLRLSDNQLSGSIPETLGNLINLHYL